MGHALLFPLALVVPFLLAAILLVPTYLGIYAAAYIAYTAPNEANPLTGRIFDVFYIIDVYTSLVHYWMQNHSSLSLFHYTLPLFGLPVVCLLVSLWLTRKIARRFIDIFHSTATN